MSSLFFGSVLLVYAAFRIASTKGKFFYVDEALWSLVWGALFLFNGLLGGPFIQNPLTDVLIFLYVIIFIFGHRFAIVTDGPPRDPKTIWLPKIGLFVIACSAIGMLSPYELYKHGMESAGVGDYASYAGTAQEVNGDVRTGLVEQTLLGKVAFSTSQAAIAAVAVFAVIGGYRRRRRIFLTVIAISPLVAFTVVSTIRSALFLAVLLLVSGTIAGLTVLGKERTLFNIRRIFLAFVVIGILGVIMFFFQSIRLGDYHFSRAGRTLEHLRIWIAGYIPAFNGWLWGGWDHKLTYGASSFRFLKALMQGNTSYLATFQSNIYIGNHTYGNASTMLRVNVNDFGLVGCGVFMFFWGALSRFLLSKARAGNVEFAVLFAFNLAAIVWSPNAWIFMYGSRVMAPAILIAYILVRRVRLFDNRVQSSLIVPTRQSIA